MCHRLGRHTRRAPPFVNKNGTIVGTKWLYRICFFDAYGQELQTHTHKHTHKKSPASISFVDAATASQDKTSPCRDLRSYCRIQVKIQILDRNPSGDSIDVTGAFLGWSVDIAINQCLRPRTRVQRVLESHQDPPQTSTVVVMAGPVGHMDLRKRSLVPHMCTHPHAHLGPSFILQKVTIHLNLFVMKSLQLNLMLPAFIWLLKC